MAKKTAIVPVSSRAGGKSRVSAMGIPPKRTPPRALWVWFTIAIVAGLVIVGIVSSVVNYWVKDVHISVNPTMPTPAMTTLKVERASQYAGLDMTVVGVQYATYFTDDDIHTGAGVVRLNMRVANHTNYQINVVYYEIARLIAPQMNPVSPTNVHLSVGPKPGKSEMGWIDFSVPKSVALDMLALRLGSTTLDETLVMIPFKGGFDGKHFAIRTSPQSLVIYYNFNGNVLTYRLKSVDVLYAYQGTQAKAGQQFYVFNFLVDNPNGVDVSPGFGYDYVRLVVNGYSQPPADTTLPDTFKKGAHGLNGRVVFIAPVGLKRLTIGFRSQFGEAQQNYDVSL